MRDKERNKFLNNLFIQKKEGNGDFPREKSFCVCKNVYIKINKII